MRISDWSSDVCSSDLYNINNGERFATYAIRAEEGSGIISVNGAAAHRAQPGDLVIICAYGACDEAEAEKFKPTMVYVDRQNVLTHTNDSIPEIVSASCRDRACQYDRNLGVAFKFIIKTK